MYLLWFFTEKSDGDPLPDPVHVDVVEGAGKKEHLRQRISVVDRFGLSQFRQGKNFFALSHSVTHQFSCFLGKNLRAFLNVDSDWIGNKNYYE